MASQGDVGGPHGWLMLCGRRETVTFSGSTAATVGVGFTSGTPPVLEEQFASRKAVFFNF